MDCRALHLGRSELRHHDRAWHPFWASLRYVLLADIDAYNGVAAAHLSSLLLRSTRLLASGEPPHLAATLSSAHEADAALMRVGDAEVLRFGASGAVEEDEDGDSPGEAD